MISDRIKMRMEKFTIAVRSGASSSTISTNSPPMGAGPTTRMTSASAHTRVAKASTMARCHDMSRMSISWVTAGGLSVAASRRRCWPIFRATARAPMLFRICRATGSGTSALGAVSNTSAAV
jgi:hypothetical protein